MKIQRFSRLISGCAREDQLRQDFQSTTFVPSAHRDGDTYVVQSPLQHATARAMFLELTPGVIGGIVRNKLIQRDLFTRGAVCTSGICALFD